MQHLFVNILRRAGTFFTKAILCLKNLDLRLKFKKKYDIIIPVPMYKTKKDTRGYNQAEVLAKELGGVPMKNDVLIKIIDTKKQSTLNKEERSQNLIGAYKIQNSEIIQNKNIILIDDIFTTGSTVNECSKILKQAGAYEICVLTIAKD